MRGIILAGGFGTRLTPITRGISKHLIPIYDKPMIYYPLSTLMLAGIKEIALVTKTEDQDNYRRLFGRGENLNISIEYFSQDNPRGIAEVFKICKSFISGNEVALILGDNIFYGSGFGSTLQNYREPTGVQFFAYQVKNPTDFGIVTFSKSGEVVEIEEKPINPISNYAIPGLYFFDKTVVEKFDSINKSARGEFEITSILQKYLSENRIDCKVLPRGTVWFDGGTVESIQEATQFISALQLRSGTKIACIEEIAWRNGWIDNNQLRKLSQFTISSDYGAYILQLSKT